MPLATHGGGRPVYEEFKPTSRWTHDDEFHHLIIELPGFKKDQIRVSVGGAVSLRPPSLTVRGERPTIGDKWSRFSESFEVPYNSDIDLISARFEDSTLRIIVPIKKVEKPDEESTEQKASESTETSKSEEVSAVVDPDSGSSSLCTGCSLPIFSTPRIPVISHGGETLFLHDQCSRLPKQLQHELHPDHDLVLLDQLALQTPDAAASTAAATCSNCSEICGTLLYQCPFMDCDFQLDLLCASQVKIFHRSHHHNLTAVRIRDFAPLTCDACDTKHEAPPPSPETKPEPETEMAATISYLCSLCGFWVHPDCASLPNAILHYEDHQHSLFLTYHLSISDDSKCLICSGIPKRSSGVYFCLKCPNYLVHIRCAVTRPETFKPVFIRDALVTDLARLPLADEHKSVIPYIREQDASTSSYYRGRLHSHPLILKKTDDGGGGGGTQVSLICNACVQLISPPYFSCSECPDFFIHSCCANLPIEIQHRAHKHPLFLSSKSPKSDISSRFVCKGCDLWCNGFAYSCKICDDYSMDVVCALINPAITHESHDKTHILFMSRDTEFGSDRLCNCCSSKLSGICYECSICRSFKLHVRCALLPGTVRHAFDEHPLQLTSKRPDIDDLCEVCEEDLERGHWFYRCGQCNQSFHVDCIASVDRLSKMKLGSVVGVEGHGCPVALVRQDEGVCFGRRCGSCGEILKIRDDGGLAYECSKCFYSVHYNCAKQSLLPPPIPKDTSDFSNYYSAPYGFQSGPFPTRKGRRAGI